MFRNGILVLVLAVALAAAQDLPTVYEYFTEGGITEGLTAEKDGFKLNTKPLKIISGAVHYWRVHPSRWRDSLRKLRASGANTVETYVAWNLHEPERNVYDFGDGNNDFSEFLNLTRYIEIAKEEDLLVLFRPGPYICSEYEFGGFPSWLLQDPNMTVRGTYPGFLERVKIYYEALLNQVRNYQFVHGGPIIAIQIENEYAYFNHIEKDYLQFLVDIYKTSGYERTLLYTSDGSWPGTSGTLPDQLLMTLNFQGDAKGNIDTLLEHQPDKPVMVMEFWTGWYDNWFENHHTWRPEWFSLEMRTIIDTYNGSINFYMFHGGTNFGFLAGGSTANPGHNAVVTSYDYDAPLTEAGDYTIKYEVISDLVRIYGYPKLKNPARPRESTKAAYGTVKPQKYLSLNSLLDQLPTRSVFSLNRPTNMELLEMNGGSGQMFGYIVHRFTTPAAQNGSLFKAGVVKDFATLMVDGIVQESSFAGEGQSRYWINSEREFPLSISTEGNHTLDLLIETVSRVNSGSGEEYATQRKGLPDGHIYLNGEEVFGFQVFALEFKNAWVKSLQNFETIDSTTSLKAPIFVQSEFQVEGEPADTFLDLTSHGWHKGIVFINGFNIGKYFKVGPQQTLYVPAPFLKTGTNTISVFEQLEVGTHLEFVNTPSIGL